LQFVKRRAYTIGMNLNDYFVRHGQKSELARAIGVPAILVSQWSLGQRPVPIARCKAIESATDGAVTCKDLRPDDWHEIWPELADSEEKLPLPSADRSSAATESVAVQGGANA